jgi:DNA sulfur modification protein DndE
MSLTKVTVSKDVDIRLRNLKARTSLNPNLLCRLGFCMSLAEPGIPDPEMYKDKDTETSKNERPREFNRYTLTGQWDKLFFALLRERLFEDGLDPSDDLEAQFKAHLSRGVFLLNQRVKTLSDIESLLLDTGYREPAGAASGGPVES